VPSGEIRSGKLAGRSMRSAIWILALPVLVQQAMAACVGLVDTIFAGRLPAATVVSALDAISIGSYVTWFIMIAMTGLGAGGQAIIARAMGAGDVYIIAREILPNVVLPVLAFALVAVATAIVVEGALSFLGLSVPSPAPSWGGMIAEGREHLQETPHISFAGAGVMFLTVLAFNLVGDTMRSRIADVRESAL